jgi:hypothetical protein
MRLPGKLAAVLMLVVSPALAQEAPSSHTLDEQLNRVQHGEPAIAREATPVAVKTHEASPSAGDVGGFSRRHDDLTQLGNGAIPALPLEIQNAGGITYLTGGIGDEEEAELKAKDHDFNTHILFTAPGGEYISDVMVRVLDAKDSHELLSTDNAGPYFFANLPAGNYTVEATAKEGGIKKLKLHVPSKGIVRQHIVFME